MVTPTTMQTINSCVLREYWPRHPLTWKLKDCTQRNAFGEEIYIRPFELEIFCSGNSSVYEEKIPNYYRGDAETAQAARRQAKISDCCVPEEDPASWQTITALFASIFCLPCGVAVCIQKYRWERYDDSLHQTAFSNVVTRIVAALKKADAILDERIANQGYTVVVSYTWKEAQKLALKQTGVVLEPTLGTDTSRELSYTEIVKMMQDQLIQAPPLFKGKDVDLSSPLLPKASD